MAGATGGGSGGGSSMRDVMIQIGADTSSLRSQFQQAQQTVDAALQQIIARLNALQQASQNAGQNAGNAAQNMGSKWQQVLGSMSGGIGGLITKLAGLAAAYLSLQGIMNGFNDTKTIIGEVMLLSNNMSISAEKASAYRQALYGLNMEAKTLVDVSKTVTTGLAKSQETFDKWGVQTRDVNGKLKDQEGVLAAVLQRVSEYKNGTDRALAAQKLMGVDLDTANKLIMLNKENLAAAGEEAKKFGTEVSGNQITALNNYNAAMDDLKTAMDGLKLAFFSDLLPAVQVFVEFIVANAPAALDILKGAAEIVIGVFEDVWDIGSYIFEQLKETMIDMFGETVIEGFSWQAAINTAFDGVKAVVVVIMAIFKSMAEIVELAGKFIGISVGQIIETIKGLQNLDPERIAAATKTAMEMMVEATNQAAGDIGKNVAEIMTQLSNLGSGKNIASGTNGFTAILDGVKAKIAWANRQSTYNKDAPAGSVSVTNENMRKGGRGRKDDEASKLLKAQTELLKAELQAQLDLLKEKNRQEKNLLDEQLRSNEISYRAYYDKIAEMAKAEAQKAIEIKTQEITELQKLQAAASKESDRVNIQAKIVKLQSELNILKMQEGEIDKENARLLKQKMEDMQKMKIDLMSDLSQASGVMDVDAEFKAIEKSYEAMKKRFAAEGDKEGEAALEKLLGYKRAQLQIAKFQQDYDLLDTNMRTKEIELETLAKKRGLTENQVQKEKLKLQREEIDNLIEIKQRQLEVAEAAYGSNSIQVAQIKQSIAELQNLKTEVNEFAKGINETMGSAFETLFDDFMSGTKSAGESFKDFVGNIVSGINKIVAQLLAQRVVNAFMNFGGTGGGGGGGGGIAGIFSGVASSGGGGGAGGGGFWSSVAGLFGGKANGGFTTANKPYLVGENGPELFVPRTSGDVVNNRDAKLFSSNRNQPIVNFNLSSPDPHAFRKTQQQTMAELSKTVTRANNRNN